jgi:hypothetical protein
MRHRRVHAVSILPTLLLGALALPGWAQTEKVTKHYEKLERAAPPSAKTTLAGLRDQIKARQFSFRVGYTQAMRYPLKRIAGLRKPPDLLQRIRTQNSIARQRLSTLPPVRAKAVCTGTEPSFDWRAASGSTAVRDQGDCGSCWAFGTHAALEGSYRVKNSQITDTAEQDTLDCNSNGWGCDGGWWAYDYLVNTGTAKEQDYPYVGQKGTCRTGVARPFGAITWGYVVDDTSIPSVVDLKRALCEHGPLGVAVNATAAFQSYAGGVFDACAGDPRRSTEYVAGDLVRVGENLYQCIQAGRSGTVAPQWPEPPPPTQPDPQVTDGTSVWVLAGAVNHAVTASRRG